MPGANSGSLGCAVLLHPTDNFSTITVREIGANTSQPHCIPMQETGKFSVAVFEWKSDGFASFEPVAVTEVFNGIDQSISGEIKPILTESCNFLVPFIILEGISTIHIGMYSVVGLCRMSQRENNIIGMLMVTPPPPPPQGKKKTHIKLSPKK